MKKKINSSEIQVGDIGLVDSYSLLARMIKFFMKVYCKLLRLPVRKFYNHAFLVVDIWGTMYVAEALGKGITVTPWESTWYKGSSRVKILRPKKELGEQEKKDLSRIAVTYALQPTRYDFLNFILQIILILTGKWIGPKGKKARKRLYCSEAAATWINEVRPGTFKAPEATNPLDIDLNENFYPV